MSGRLTSLVCAAAIGAAGLAYASRGAILTCGLFAVLCTVLIGLLWRHHRSGRNSRLNDPGISTLVFPPESKFQHSVHPRR
jgi:hypothetical protein